MQYPDVTRAISFEISGKRVTGRWLAAEKSICFKPD
jgi:hypothetical protein